MTPLSFFRRADVRRALSRTSRGAAVPISVHHVAAGEEGPLLAGAGGCAACAYVASLAGGEAACRASRIEGAALALNRSRPTGYGCHMGFGCVSVPALGAAAPGFVLTLGPYCPAESPRGLGPGVKAGLARLHAGLSEAFEEALSEVRVLPSDALVTMAEWTVEVLADLWEEVQEPDEPPEPVEIEEPAPEPPAASGKAAKFAVDAYHAGDIAAALAAGNQPQARNQALAALAETKSRPRPRIDVQRARTVAMVSAVIEAAERAELHPRPWWNRFDAFLEEVRGCRTEQELSAAAMRLLNRVGCGRNVDAASVPGLAELNVLIMAKLPERVMLKHVAAELGENPTAITHRLQRKFGMSFTEYVGRIRIDRAKELLRRTHLSVTEISRRVGGGDVSNFSKLFRKFEAMAPLEYRRQFGSSK